MVSDNNFMWACMASMKKTKQENTGDHCHGQSLDAKPTTTVNASCPVIMSARREIEDALLSTPIFRYTKTPHSLLEKDLCISHSC